MKFLTVYIVTNKPGGELYTGITSGLARRAWQHRAGQGSRFAAQYGCKRLVWYEAQADMPMAIAREKQIKGESRANKVALIEAVNPDWHDLWDDIAEPGLQRLLRRRWRRAMTARQGPRNDRKTLRFLHQQK